MLNTPDLVAKYKQLYAQATENLTVVQNRCTALLQECRALKWLVTSDAIESRILADVVHERRMQDQKWGLLNEKMCDTPDGTGPTEGMEASEYSFKWMLDLHRDRVRINGGDQSQSLMSILLEEVLEAAVETEPDRLRKELVQVGAVVVKWIHILDMRRARNEARVHESGLGCQGWWCEACGGFNGSAKEELRACRCCGSKRPGFGLEQTEASGA